MADQELDCRGLRCPRPLVLLSKTMRQLAIGQTLCVVADDPAFRADVEAWAGSGMAAVRLWDRQGEADRVLLVRCGG